MREQRARATHPVRTVLAGCLCGTLITTGWVWSAEDTVPVTRDFTVHIWRKEHGLPDNRVLCLLTARNGFLWAGTRRGLVRFDGRDFVTTSRSTHPVFLSEECTSLAEDSDGSLWVGTIEGVIHLSAVPERFAFGSLGLAEDGAAPTRYSDQVTQVVAGKGGRLLVGTRTGAVTRNRQGRWERVDLGDWSANGTYLPSSIEDSQGTCWIGTTYQLFCQPASGSTWEPQFPQPVSVETHFVHALAADPENTLYAIIGNWNSQSGFLFRQEGSKWERVSDETIRNASNPIWLFIDSAGGLWHPNEDRVLTHRVGDHVTRYTLPMLAKEDSPLCMAEDAEGNFWLGGYEGGLIGLRPRVVQMVPTGDAQGEGNCWTLMEGSDGALWVGTDAGVSRLLPEGDAWHRADPVVGTPNIRALAEDRQGRVWIGSGTGLQRRKGGILETLSFAGEWWRTKIRCLCAASDGSVWVGSAAGLHRVIGDEVQSWFAPDDLPHDDIRAVLEDRSGHIWIGTFGGGVARYDGRQFTCIGQPEGLRSLKVWALHEDSEGTLWMGTDRGLHCLRGGQIGVITTDHGLPDNLVNGLVEDNRGRLWLGHDRGIYAARRDELLAVADGRTDFVRCVALDEEDGLTHLETNGQKSYPPGIRLRDGRIAFATVDGVALIDPSYRIEPSLGPPAHIELMRAGGTPFFENHPGSTHPTSREHGPPPLRIPPSQNRAVEIAFTACSFRGADLTRFRYRLLGLTSEWADAGGLRKASFASLPPGAYVFEVQAANKYGLWGQPPQRLAFRIEPRYHERIGMRLAAVLLLIGAVYGGVKWRLNELRRLHELEAQAARAQERARLAKDLHDGLGARLTELTLLSGVQGQSISSEEVNRRFQLLSQSTQAAMRSLRDLLWTANPKADTVEGLVSRVCDQAEAILMAAALRCRLEIPAQLPRRNVGPEIRREVLLACNEAVHNAVRHAHAREVWIRFKTESGSLVIRIEDDGCGFDVEGALRASRGGDTGLGLESLAQRLQGIRGHCEIRSQPGKGTSVELRIPL